MKHIFATITIFLSFYTSQANHVLGGEITWECNGNNEYVFQLVVYNDCSDIQTTPSTQSISWSGGAAIPCALVDTFLISPDCGGSTGINCDTTILFTPVKKYIYRSNPINLLGPVPPLGWTFWSFLQARPDTDNMTGGGTNGYMLRAKMYRYIKNAQVQSPSPCYDSSPQFEEKPRYAFNTDSNYFYLDGYDTDLQDSIHFEWAQPLNYSTTFPGAPLGYETGYSYTQPLPGPSISSGNSVTSLLGNGLLSFKSVTTGRFTTCYKIESYRDGQLIAEVFRDFELQVNIDLGAPGLCGFSPNFAPAVAFGWNPGFPTLTPVVINNQIAYYKLDVFAGDTVSFRLVSQDVDLKPNCVPQTITASATGPSMSNGFTGTSDCENGPCANLQSLNSGGGYASTLNNEVQFYWITDTAHVNGPKGRGSHRFLFSFTDNHCVLPTATEIQIIINVIEPIYAVNAQLGFCEGDSAQAQIRGDVSNLLWSPSTNISCTTCDSPILYPISSTTYTVTDLNSNYSLEIDVQVDTIVPVPQLVQNGSELELQNASIYDSYTWIRNTAPFYPQDDSIFEPWLSGEYWVDAGNGACVFHSDTFNYNFTNNLTATNSKGMMIEPESNSQTYGATIKLNQESYYTIDGFYVEAFDKNSSGANLGLLSCKIYDAQSVVVYQSDSATRVTENIIKFHGETNLGTNQDYFVTFFLDTSVVVPTFKPNNWPVVANAGRVYVYNAQRVPGDNFPINSSQSFPYFNISLKWGIGVDEASMNLFEVYPNPANTILNVKVSSPSHFVLVNSLGQNVAQGNVETEKVLDVSQFKAGVYFLVMENDKGSVERKRVVIVR